MITLKKVFDTLAFGELSNTKFGSTGAISEDHYEQVLSYVNLGLTELYKRFILKQNEVQLQQHEDVSRYYLRSEHLGEVEEMDDYIYLLYSEAAPLQDDVIKILSVYDSAGVELPVNDRTATQVITTPEPDVLLTIPEDPTEILSINYQAAHEDIVYNTDLDPSKIWLDLPAFVLAPLCYYVAACVFRGINSSITEGTVNPGVTYNTQFEIACQKIDVLDLSITSSDASQRFSNNGWI